MADDDHPKPGDAFRASGIAPMSPWEFLAHIGQRVTPAIARALANETGTTDQFWLNMQEAFDGVRVAVTGAASRG